MIWNGEIIVDLIKIFNINHILKLENLINELNLTDRQKEIFMLRYYNGFSCNAISSKLDIRLNETVKEIEEIIFRVLGIFNA